MLRPTWPSEPELDAAAGGSSFTELVSAAILGPSSLNTMPYSKLATPLEAVCPAWNFQVMVPLTRHVAIGSPQLAVKELGRIV